MNVLLMQENGRHAENRDFRECHAMFRAFSSLGHECVVWGLGHPGYPDQPNFERFDLILNLENYDEQGWLPNLSKTIHPIKMIWAVDEHDIGQEYYQRLFERDICHWWLHSTLDYVRDPRFDYWMPNAVDMEQVRSILVPNRAEIGFCGNILNRKDWLELLNRNFRLQVDAGVIGEDMVRAINSYQVAFNRNISHDINARNFEVIACGVPLITNFNPQYRDLGFRHRDNCVFYQNEESLITELRWLLGNDVDRKRIARNGQELSKRHTYLERAKEIIGLFEKSRAFHNQRLTINRSKPDKITIGIITNSGLDGKESRRPGLEQLLSSIKFAGFPENIEIIVAGALKNGLANVKVLALEDEARTGNVSCLRNAIAAVATGDLIIQCDDDILFTPGYWQAVESHLSEDWDILCTRLLNPNGSRYWDWAIHTPGLGQSILPYNVGGHTFSYATGGHALYRKSVFQRVKWDEQVKHGENEELTLARAARQSGLKYRFCEKATVYLQSFHCDAEATVSGTPPSPANLQSAEYIKVLHAVDPAQAGSNEANLRKRLAHKLVSTSPGAPKPKTELPTVSILVACHRFLQRFRVFAQTICFQEYPKHKIEVIVANPDSPDGLSNYIFSLNQAANGSPTFIEVKAPAEQYRNRGFLIQRAFEKCTGSIVVGMDCDLVLPCNFLKKLVPLTLSNPDRIVGVYRQFLSAPSTTKVLTGLIDPIQEFATLSIEDHQEKDGYRGVLGYCQASIRENWEKTGYPEEFDSIAKSDVAFSEKLGQHGVSPYFIPEIRVLHLHHPRNWEGTTDFL